MQAFSTALVGTSFQLAARDSGQRPQSILSLAERSDSKVMSMHKELSVKSRVRGDFHARFCERVRVKLPRSTRPMTPQTARDCVKTKTGHGDKMDIQEAEEFQTSKFFCKTDFNMDEIKAEEADYEKYPIPKFYKFKSNEERERILYANFLKVNAEVKSMIAEIQEFNKK